VFEFGFRISNFEFAARHSPDTVDLAVLARRTASSTVNEPQSASNQQYKHSYLSESRGGQSPTWLSEGGREGALSGDEKLFAGANELEVEAFGRHQLVVGSLLNDAPAIHNHDAVGALDCRQRQ